jgi:hypothetical protein
MPDTRASDGRRSSGREYVCGAARIQITQARDAPAALAYPEAKMTRGTQALVSALGAAVGLGVGLVGGKLATGSMSGSAQANTVLATSVLGAAAGAAVASYTTTPKLLAQ